MSALKDKKTTQIKLEATSSETITDIQNYLDNFNKEIQTGDGTTTIQPLSDVQQLITDSDSANEGTYFMDENGQYYFQSNPSETPVLVSNIPNAAPAATNNQTTYVAMQSQGNQNQASTVQTIQTVQDGQRMIINPGDSYQTVTIVPSDTNPGEVSYVLIVQQPEDDKDGEEDEDEEKNDDQDLTVYDFDEGEDGGPGPLESGDEDDKTKIVKILPKKSQTVTQAHMCNYCNYTSPKRYLLSRHMKSHSEERPHKCSVCERGFKTLASLQNHVNTHTGTKPHRCKFCDSCFTTSGELVRHVRYKHTHEKPHKCSVCDYASVELSKMRNHMRCHTGERPYQCPHCTYASPDTFKLKRHLRIHTGEKPYECDFCRARFTQSNSLKAHMLIHRGDPNFSSEEVGDKPIYRCELCPTTCGRKTDLRIHVQKLHTSDKPLKCKRCGKTFPDRYTYKVHNKTHEGEKCYKCDLCPYASISARHLESHMLIHTDQKPYQCEMCDQSFRQKQLLKRHQNLYHNPQYVPPCPREKTHECPECGRTFRHKGNLIRHMAVHDPDATTQEKAMALKLGRQKKIQIIDGQQVEVMPEDEMEDEEDDEDEDSGGQGMMAVQGSDGQQYVVLEVIQLQDGDGQEQALAVVTDNMTGVHNSVGHDRDDDSDSGELITGHHPSLTNEQILQVQKMEETKDGITLKRVVDPKSDMQNCFGFDEDDDDADMEIEGSKIHILQSIT
ncbi:transcriptional repressor CTCFL isoform X1 [Thrips palmi]|uniref:Transcriptional repressor CTCFL isoform X1 n=1 Tax=Thrips palmi TaxID=161013 RepID=A0A6P8XZ99_THRPL|nr:transcriptional repressor CTCFL isoform X1 [Thrips palmi]XP_034232458.1 transcriptional repressor CTCFL isoform X1 [Thrips palmi]